MGRTEEVKEWCRVGELPDAGSFYETLTEENGRFTEIEGLTWDFKHEWPFSLSDDYFAGISRLVCAFANAAGGLIVFGVDDAKRTGGHNKVRPNIDKFLQAFSQLTGSQLQYDFRSYESATKGDVQVLLIKPRQAAQPPLRFRRELGRHAANILWVRSGHEVVAATPSHFPVLFCRADPTESVPERDGSIPPSPATMKRFVGRAEVLDRLFSWLETSDEPRTYLHGKGGSGKTTIAYEFARLVKDFGDGLRMERSDPVDVVVFLSAKERALVPATGEVEALNEPDFSDEKSLLSQLLYYGGWTPDKEYLEKTDVAGLRREVQQYLDLTSVLMVLDDVDTLTTKGVDPGSDNLYRALCRSKRRSKVLYTLRNAPTQSLHSSIEVPGLEGADYEIFVAECAKQFNVKEPSRDFRTGRLPQISERRPLVIESIVALVRTAGTYERAADLFTQHAGDNVRDYVFIREWDALTGDPTSRLLLSALADLKRPATFSDLQTVLQTDDSRVRDGIGKVREMFLQLDQAGEETLFSLAPLTRSFVNSRKMTLKGYSHIAERVRAFKSNIKLTSPDVVAIVAKVQRLLPARDVAHEDYKIQEAWRIVTDPTLKPAVTEDPVFKCAFGYVCVHLPKPRLTEAREAFNYATSMRHEPSFFELRSWYSAEKRSGMFDDWCERVANIVINGRSYSESDKIEMIARKATSIYARAKERLHTDPIDAQKDLYEALVLHLRAFRLNSLRGDTRAAISEEYARNTAWQWFQLALKTNQQGEFFDRLRQLLASKDVFFDPIETPAIETIERLERLPMAIETLQRFKAKTKGLPELMSHRDSWLDQNVSRRLVEAVRRFEEALGKRGKK